VVGRTDLVQSSRAAARRASDLRARADFPPLTRSASSKCSSSSSASPNAHHNLASSWSNASRFLMVVAACCQGLTLVRFSAQLEPCLTHENTLHTLNTPFHGLHDPYAHPLSHTKRSS